MTEVAATPKLPFRAGTLSITGFTVLRAMVDAGSEDGRPEFAWTINLVRTALPTDRVEANDPGIVAVGNLEAKAKTWFMGASVMTRVLLPSGVSADDVAEEALQPVIARIFGEVLYDAAALIVRQLAAMVHAESFSLPRRPPSGNAGGAREKGQGKGR